MSGIKVLLIASCALFAMLQYRLWLGAGGLNEVAHLQQQIKQQRSENELLSERNRTLAAEVDDLKQGTAAIEERARTDLGMVGAGETFYQVIATKVSAGRESEHLPQDGAAVAGKR
jgi:cell division protein FtsB